MDCSNCKKEIIYEPYYCQSCDEIFCLFCLDIKSDIHLCKKCYKTQSSLKIIPKIKCKDCEEMVDSYLCECGNDIVRCSYHAKSCFICKKRICQRCEFCTQDGVKCQICNKMGSRYTSVKCELCKGSVCAKNCLYSHVEEIQGYKICKKHYTIQRYGGVKIMNARCDFKDCFNLVQTTDYFRPLIKESFSSLKKGCIEHKKSCISCKNGYLDGCGKTIILRSKKKFIVCEICFNSLKLFINCCKNLQKDVLDKIIYLVIN